MKEERANQQENVMMAEESRGRHLPIKQKTLLMFGVLILTLLAFVAGGISIGAASAAGPNAGTATTDSGKHVKLAVEVSSVSENTIHGKNKGASAVTIVTNGSTTYQSVGKSASLSAVKAGVTIDVVGTKNSDGSVTAQTIEIGLADTQGGKGRNGPQVSGSIGSIAGSTITLKGDVKVHTIKTTASTIFLDKKAGGQITLAALKVDEYIVAIGILNGDDTLTAQYVQVVPPSAPGGGQPQDAPQGKISAINGTTLTLDSSKIGKALTIKTSADTRFFDQKNNKDITLADLKVGDMVFVKGESNSDGSVTAFAIVVGTVDAKGGDKHPGDNAMGRISAINGTTISIDGGKIHTITTTSTTRFGDKRDGKAVSLADFKVGDDVYAEGGYNASGACCSDCSERGKIMRLCRAIMIECVR